MRLRWILPCCFSLFAWAELRVVDDVPFPTEYQIRYQPDGSAYVLVTKFEREQIGYSVGAGEVYGVVTQVTAGHGGRSMITLRANNGMVFAAREGETIRVSGQSFRAVGWENQNFVLQHQGSGARFLFRYR